MQLSQKKQATFNRWDSGKHLIGFAAAVYLLMVILSVTCLVRKRDGLQFHILKLR